MLPHRSGYQPLSQHRSTRDAIGRGRVTMKVFHVARVKPMLRDPRMKGSVLAANQENAWPFMVESNKQTKSTVPEP